MIAGIIFIPLYWKCSELQFDTLIQKIESGEAEKFIIANSDKDKVSFAYFALEGLALPQPLKTDNLDDEFLRFPRFDFLNKVSNWSSEFSIKWCKNLFLYFILFPT